MSAGEISSVAVIGAGNMGHQISLCCALAGLETSCTDVSEEQLQEAEAFMEKYLSGRVAKGKLLPESADQAAKRLRFTTSLEEAVREADFVIEAITEKLDLKKDLFRKLDQLCPPQTILATNSSFLSARCWPGRRIVRSWSAICISLTQRW